MIRAGVGFSAAPDPARAAEEAARQALRGLEGLAPQGCVAFLTAHHAAHLDRALQAMQAASGTPYVVGCSTAAVLGPGREMDEGPALGLLALWSDRLRFTPLLFGGEPNPDAGALAFEVGVRVGASRGRGDLLLLWPGPYRIPAARFLEALGALLGPVAVAGAEPPLLPRGGAFAFRGSEVRRGWMSGARLGGEFRVHVAVAQGCRPLGPLRVATHTEGNVILRLDGCPALEVLAETALGVPGSRDTWARMLLVGLVPEGAPQSIFLARPIVGCDPRRGWIALAEQVAEGQRLWIAVRDPKTCIEELARTLRGVGILAREGGFRFGFYFSGVARGRRLHRRSAVETGLIADALPGLPWLGMAGGVEFAPLGGANRVLSHSGVLVLVAD